jgi:hypothetical protein
MQSDRSRVLSKCVPLIPADWRSDCGMNFTFWGQMLSATQFAQLHCHAFADMVKVLWDLHAKDPKIYFHDLPLASGGDPLVQVDHQASCLIHRESPPG